MKIRSLHKNLDTAFVDLSALLRHLRRDGFIGVVSVEIENYKAEVIFDEARQVRMREFVNGPGRLTESESVLRRLLDKAQTPGGIINVYEAISTVAGKKPISKFDETADILDLKQKVKPEVKAPAAPREAAPQPAPIPKPVGKAFAAVHSNGSNGGNGNGKSNGNGHSINGFHHEKPLTNGNAESEAADIGAKIDTPAAADIFPIYSHPVEVVEDQPEMKMKVSTYSPQEWEDLIGTSAALLGTIDSILKSANLGFCDAFLKARVEISNEYPFLHPLKGIFYYEDGKVTLNEEVPPNLLVSGISECLRRIMNKLISNPKFFAVYKHITQQVLILVRQRQPQFDKFGYTRQLERIIKF